MEPALSRSSAAGQPGPRSCFFGDTLRRGLGEDLWGLLRLLSWAVPSSPPHQVAGELKYHPECFICLTCGTFIGDGDTYTLVEHSKLYW